MYIQALVFAFAALPSASAAPKRNEPYNHVAVFSVDGLHASDIDKYIALRPNSSIAALLKTGYQYSGAYTSAPSDSFPGTVAQFTGATPRTTGVWYDDIWNRDIFAPGSDSDSTEDLDYNSSQLFSGGINPANLPKIVKNGQCVLQYPHDRLQVNTVFEVIKAKGKQTAYVDKHPAYDLVRGPSGTGLSTGCFPEIASIPGNNVPAVIAYDQLHVNAFLDYLDATVPEHSEGTLTAVPALFGGNFQSVNVAQKTYGYQNATNFPFTAPILEAIDFVDASLGAVVNKLKSKGLYNDTLIIVASKHGNAPINPALFGEVDPAQITNATGVAVEWQTSDDIALVFLNKSSTTATAVANLDADRTAGKILNSMSLMAGIKGFGSPINNPFVPDIIVQPDHGIIYTTSKKKVEEHGGLSADDRNVACFVSSPRIRKAKNFTQRVFTTQIAPLIVEALGIDSGELEGVRAEGTDILPGFD
ncbi:type I phosphodiesterase/nucleotide pyrophosphatase [Usnea florida]